MASLLTGNNAIYAHGECVWVYGKAEGKLTSGSFNSCVGLALWGATTKGGAVAHFSGSMSGKLDTAEADAKEILLKVAEGSQDAQAWRCWIFGGVSLQETFEKIYTRDGTLELMAAVKRGIDAAQLDIAYQTGEAESHLEVTLDLGSGAVSWGSPKKPEQERKEGKPMRRNSLGSVGTKKYSNLF